MENKKVKQMMVDVYQGIFPFECFEWIYCSTNDSAHIGEIVSWSSDSEYPDSIYYGTTISLTANQLKGK